jgi:hypothetical protein
MAGIYGVVVTTGKVAEEAKRFFREEKPDKSTSFETIEGHKAFEGSIRSLVDRYSRVGVTESLSEMSEIAGINVIPVVEAWMSAVASRTKVASVATPLVSTAPAGATA